MMRCAQCGKDYPSKYYFSSPSICTECYQQLQSSANSSESLKCPECKNQLIEKRRSGITIDECEKCSGIWFDSGELESYCIISGTNRESVTQILSQLKLQKDCPKLICPRCQLKSIEYGSADEIKITHCSKCAGVFLNNKQILKVTGQNTSSKKRIPRGTKEGASWFFGDFIVDIVLEFFD